MTLSNTYVDRGKRGNTPELTLRADQSYLEYLSDARDLMLNKKARRFSTVGMKVLKERGIPFEHTLEVTGRVREEFADVEELAVFLRIKRSLQEAYKERIIGSFGLIQQTWENRLDEADSQGPGSVKYDLDWEIPDYATREMHIQPGGFVRAPLVGLYYDYNTQIFFADDIAADAMHAGFVAKTPPPQDGKVERFMEIGCGIGQIACELKKVYPDAEAWGTDIAAPMVRYSHWRAMQQDLDIHFSQMPAEDLDFPDGHFDLIVAHILFHEIPVPVIRKVIAEAYRALRPGGLFVIWDFGTASEKKPGYNSLLGLMDAADNGEPYALGFVNCGVEDILKETGFTLRDNHSEGVFIDGRFADKPVRA
jgi:SAM-dependent methyltransferase